MLALGLLAAPLLAWSPTAAQAEPSSHAAERFGLSNHSVQRLVLEPSSGSIRIPVQLDGRSVTLVLVPATLRTRGFRLLVQGADGSLRDAPAPPPRTYGGRIEELTGSSAGGSIGRDGLHAAIGLADGRVFFVQPLAGTDPASDPALHVVYSGDAVDGGEGSCAVDEAQAVVPASPGPGSRGLGGPRVADLAIDADFEFFTKNDSSVVQTLEDIETVMNAVNVVYQRDCDLTHRLATVIVRSSEPDPYSATSADPLLDELETHWNGPLSGVVRDAVHLMTGKAIDGGTIGYAAVGAICNRNRAYGLSQSRYTSNLSRRTALTAHELGHNWNAVHCNAEEECNIMCSSINGCDGIGLPNFEPAGIQDIVDFAASRTCLDSPPLAVGERAPQGAVRLAAPQPSPFSGQTRLSFHLEEAGRVRLGIYDVAGHRVASLAEGAEAPGWHTRAWNGLDDRSSRLAPGVYYARLEARGETLTRKLILMW